MSFDRTSRDPRDAGRGGGGATDALPAPGKQTLTAGLPAAPAVQRQAKPGAAAGSCDISFPKTQNAGPGGTTCRRFDGVTTYKMVSEARLKASGYKFWTSDGMFDKWIRVDGSSELWLQLPRQNAATSEKAIGQLRSIISARKTQLDELQTLAQLMDNPDPNVAAAARENWEERMAEFPGFDDDYAQVPALREQVDADHRKAFEDQVDQLMEQRDRYDPQSTRP